VLRRYRGNVLRRYRGNVPGVISGDVLLR